MKGFCKECDRIELQGLCEDHAAEIEDLRDEVERLRVQLAGCGVAANGSTKIIALQGEYGWSPAYQDVLNLRRRHDNLRRHHEINVLLLENLDEII